MPELPSWASEALAGIYDPCCQEKGISVIDMGLVPPAAVGLGQVVSGPAPRPPAALPVVAPCATYPAGVGDRGSFYLL